MIEASTIAVDSITLDVDLQPRTAISEELVTEYASRLLEGVALPPVVVFLDGATHWLADGFHRWHAHRALGREHIEAEVRQGSRRHALVYSLSANSRHGQRRTGDDMRKAYGIAVRVGLVGAVDVLGVAHLLACSERWARELTRDAREAADQARDAVIVAEKATGASNREVARRLGVDHKTVAAGEKRNSSEIPHPIPPEWSHTLTTLALVAGLPHPDRLFDNAPPAAVAAAAGTVDQAVAWMGGFARRLASA